MTDLVYAMDDIVLVYDSGTLWIDQIVGKELLLCIMHECSVKTPQNKTDNSFVNV